MRWRGSCLCWKHVLRLGPRVASEAILYSNTSKSDWRPWPITHQALHELHAWWAHQGTPSRWSWRGGDWPSWSIGCRWFASFWYGWCFQRRPVFLSAAGRWTGFPSDIAQPFVFPKNGQNRRVLAHMHVSAKKADQLDWHVLRNKRHDHTTEPGKSLFALQEHVACLPGTSSQLQQQEAVAEGNSALRSSVL